MNWENGRMKDEDRCGLYHRRNEWLMPEYVMDAVHAANYAVRPTRTTPHQTDHTRAEWLQFAEFQLELDAMKRAKRKEQIRQRAQRKMKERAAERKEREATKAVSRRDL
jgi:hypothetical protein